NKINILFVSSFLCLLSMLPLEAEEFKFKAMCYGPGLYGNKTASGIRLSKTTEGVAHKTWNFGSEITLKYKDKTIRTKVIDRGPYAKGVHLDLTEATAKSLGFKSCREFGSRYLIVEN
ncbi:MAG TPA: septal ring lytic transglycosylase RlpA family protein, partial [Vampirovibrionales bacterium]